MLALVRLPTFTGLDWIELSLKSRAYLYAITCDLFVLHSA